MQKRRPPVVIADFAVVQKTAYDFVQQEVAYLERYHHDSVAALVRTSAKISPSDQELFQFYHESVPENERLNNDTQKLLGQTKEVLAETRCTMHSCRNRLMTLLYMGTMLKCTFCENDLHSPSSVKWIVISRFRSE